MLSYVEVFSPVTGYATALTFTSDTYMLSILHRLVFFFLNAELKLCGQNNHVFCLKMAVLRLCPRERTGGEVKSSCRGRGKPKSSAYNK